MLRFVCHEFCLQCCKIGPAGSVDVALDVVNSELNQLTSRTIETSLCESCKCWKVEIMNYGDIIAVTIGCIWY